MADTISPPTYGQQEQSSDEANPLQILITPCAGTTSFQNGYLGADNEHCSIEGEVQIKGAAGLDLENITIAFRTVEAVEHESEVELTMSKLVLFTVLKESASFQLATSPPSTLPFSIPLTADIPEAVSTPSSSITHTLVATLTPRTGEPIVESIPVDITRYTAPNPSASDLSLEPLTVTVDAPSQATVQIPRTVYRVGEIIPLYVTIPTPERAAIASGLRLRNVKADLVRTVFVGPPHSDSDSSASAENSSLRAPEAGGSRIPSTSSAYPSEKVSLTTDDNIGGHSSIIRRSGAACRFHSSRPIKLRLVLHDNESNTSGTITQSTLLHRVAFHIQLTVAYTASGNRPRDDSAPSSSISIPIVMLPQLAPAREGDFSKEVDTAYHKKHDPPPARTYRPPDADDNHGEGPSELPSFDDHSQVHHTFASNSSGAHLGGGFPPPPSFSEASAPSTSYAAAAPPPSFDDAAGIGTVHHVTLPPSFEDTTRPPGADGDDENGGRGHLPTFMESESEVQAQARAFVSENDPNGDSSRLFGFWAFDPHTERQALHFPGEGSIFGFTPAEQYDGISQSMTATAGAEAQDSDGSISTEFDAEDIDRVSLGAERTSLSGISGSAPQTLPLGPPPPGIDESIAAAVTAAFAAATSSSGTQTGSGPLPPPPPALDDPSDPPPSIDDGVQSLSIAQQTRRERAMVEAAHAHAVASRSTSIPVVPDDVHAPPPPPLDLDAASVASSGSPVVHTALQEPPPYLGVPQPGVATARPPPYVG